MIMMMVWADLNASSLASPPKPPPLSCAVAEPNPPPLSPPKPSPPVVPYRKPSWNQLDKPCKSKGAAPSPSLHTHTHTLHARATLSAQFSFLRGAHLHSLPRQHFVCGDRLCPSEAVACASTTRSTPRCCLAKSFCRVSVKLVGKAELELVVEAKVTLVVADCWANKL